MRLEKAGAASLRLGTAADVGIQLSGPKVLTLQAQETVESTSTEAEFR
jgi:hypothetical protein